MIFYAITALINAIASTILGLFIYFKNKKVKINQSFALFCLSVAFWSYAYYFWQIADNAKTALFWSRELMFGAIFITIFYFHFILRLLNKIKENKKILIFGYLIFIFFFFTNFSSLIVKNVRPKLGFSFWPDPGIFYHLFLFFWLFYAVYAIYFLFKEYYSSSGIKQSQIRYILIGTILGYLGGATNYLLWYDIPISPIGNWTTTLYLTIVAYAIIKYRLMDIGMAVKRSTIFSLIVIVITAIYAMSAYLVSWIIFGGTYTFQTQIITGLIVALLVAIAFRPLYEWLKNITDGFLFKGEYLPQELMADISDVVSRTLDLDTVIDTLKNKIIKALRIRKIEIIILEDEEANLSITRGDFLMTSKKKKALKKIIAYFKNQREVLVLEELKRKHEEENKSDKAHSLIEEIENLKAFLIIPLMVKNKLVGLFLLSAKRSGDMFTNEDIKTLETIASQAGIAIENSRLYEEMKDFSKTLQKEVNSQTKELRDANVRLKQLDSAKSEFISLASHQLRTPLSIIKGYVSMMMEGTWGQVTDKQKEQLNKVYLSNERLIKLVEDLLTVSRIESGRLDFKWELVSLEDMVESVIEEFSQKASKRNLYLKYIKSKEGLPKIRIDSLKIRQVVQNLVDNALHYTKKGGIIIRLKKKGSKIVFSIKDTGIGISQKEQVALFEKFSRGREVGKMHTEGVGLGLYLGAKMVIAHHGKIWIESEGKGKGSTFYFELPIKRKK